jgi:hypothetical protein
MISPKIPIPEDDTAPGVIGTFKVSDDEYRVQIDVSDSNIAYFRVVCETRQIFDTAIQLYHPEYFKDARKLIATEKEELIKFLVSENQLRKVTNYVSLCDLWDSINNEYSSYPEEDNYWELDMPDYNLLEVDL